jgi:hypoxanthine phosphoribosyltransferase
MAIDVYFSEEQIKNRVKELAQEITRDFAGEELVVIGVLNGAFMFCADLVRELDLPVNIEFMSASSYVGTESSGEVTINLDLRNSIKDKNVLVVEDIVDTGLTMTQLLRNLEQRNPKKLKLATLLYKPARTEHKVDIDYLAFEIEDKFVIGYGLDFDGRYRELPYIGIYNND